MSVTTIETQRAEPRDTPQKSKSKATLTLRVKRANGTLEEPVEVPVEVYEINETKDGRF